MKGHNSVMNMKAFRLLATSLLLVLVLVSVFFVSASPQAHAAQLKPAVAKSNTLPLSEKQTDSARTAMNNCKPAGTVYTNWWGLRIHLTSCGVQLVESGIGLGSLFPGAAIPGGVTLSALSATSALSCDGSVDVEMPWDWPTVVSSLTPGC